MVGSNDNKKYSERITNILIVYQVNLRERDKEDMA